MKSQFILLSIVSSVLLACGSTSNPAQPKAGTQTGEILSSKASEIAFMKDNVSVDADGKLKLSDKTSWEGSSTGQTGYDAGMNALKNGVEGVGKEFGAVKGYRGEKASVYLRDPAVAGWSYQTIGHVIPKDGSRDSYVVVGKAYTPADTETINATYKGISTGTFFESDGHGGESRSEIIANMTADLKWGAGSKTLDINIQDSQVAYGNITGGEFNGLAKGKEYDFKETLKWDGKDRFKGETAQAQLYGKAEEVAGTFERKPFEGTSYSGAFAGKKQ